MRQVGFNIVEALGVNLVTHGDREPERESLFGLHVERFAFQRAFEKGIFGDAGGEQLVARIEELDVFDHGHNKMDTGVESSGQGAASLADADAGHAGWDDDDCGRDEQWRPGEHDESDRSAPADGRFRPGGGSLHRVRQATPVGDEQVGIVGENGGGDHEHRDAGAEQQVLYEQHGSAPFD